MEAKITIQLSRKNGRAVSYMNVFTKEGMIPVKISRNIAQKLVHEICGKLIPNKQ